MDLEIVMFNMSSYSEWQKGTVNRNYHIFYKLLNRPEIGRIIAVDFLPFTFKRALRNYWENILFGPEGKVVYRDLTTRCVKIDGYPAELYVFSTIDSIFSHKLVIKKLNKVLNLIEVQSSKFKVYSSPKRMIWSYFPMFVDCFSAEGGENLPHDLMVFDAVDNWIKHPSFIRYKKLLEDNYQTIAKKSDLIFVVADALVEFFKKIGRKKDVYWIANGVDVSHFAESQLSIINDKLFNKIPHPVIGYVGTIQHRIDLGLLEYLAKNNPDKSFVLVGPLWPVFLRKLRRPAVEIKKLKKYKNVYLLGRKFWEETPAYIKKFDVGISPHKLDEFSKYTNSLKVLEYLACGLPVVATPTSEVERFSHFIYISRDYGNFSEKIDLALKNDTMELRNLRIARVKQEDWDLKVGEIMKYIIEKVKTKK